MYFLRNYNIVEKTLYYVYNYFNLLSKTVIKLSNKKKDFGILTDKEHFVGIKSFWIRSFLEGAFSFSTNVPLGDNIQIANYFGEEKASNTKGGYNLISTEKSSLSKNLNGKTRFKDEITDKIYPKEREKYSNGESTIYDTVLKDLKNETDYEDLTHNLLNGFKEIQLQQEIIIESQKNEKNQGFDVQVLQNLIDSLHKYLIDINNGISSYRKNIFASVLLMALTYFFSNGRDFLDFEPKEYSSAVKDVCARCISVLPEETTNINRELLTTFFYRGKELLFENLIFESNKNNQNYLYVSADGGFGKTTNMLYTAKQLNFVGIPAIYVPCNKIDNEFNEYFILNSIGCVFEDYERDFALAPDKYGLLAKIISEELAASRLVVFFDAINESAHKQALYRQISALKSKIDPNNIQIVVSSRSFSSNYKNEGFYQIAMKPLNAEEILRKSYPSKFKLFNQLDKKTKELLGTPMFLKMFIDSNKNENINAANLLKSNHNKTLEKCQKLYSDSAYEVLDKFLPEFTRQSYCAQTKMVFKCEELQDFLKNNQNKYNCGIDRIIDILKTASDVITQDGQEFVYRHEHIRDFLVAYNIFKRIVPVENDLKKAQKTILEIFSNKGIYGIFVQRFFGELVGKDKVIGLLDCLRKDYIAGEWYEAKVAVATSEIIEIYKLLNDNIIDDEILYGLNLSQTQLNGVQILEHDFLGCLISNYTFSPSGHDSAVFSVTMFDNYIYALGNNKLIKYTNQLEMVDLIDYSGTAPIVSYALSGSTLAAINSTGSLYFFSLGENICFNCTDYVNAVFVEKINSGFLVGYADGYIRFFPCYSNIHTKEYKVESEAVMPIAKPNTNQIIYATKNAIKIWDIKLKESSELWRTKNEMEIQNVFVPNDISKAIVAINKFGETRLYPFDIKQKTILDDIENEIYRVEAASDLIDYQIQKSRGIDATICNCISFIDNNNMIVAFNDGNVLLFNYNRTNSKWQRIEQIIEVVHNADSNAGFAVESLCFSSTGIVCGLTDRDIKCISCDFDNESNSGFVKYEVSGHNNGLRRICKINNTLFVPMYDKGFVILSRANESDNFIFKNKVMLCNTWGWSAVAIDNDTLAVSVGNNIYLYYSHGNYRLIQSLDGKVESLAYSGEFLLAASNENVYKISLDNNDFKAAVLLPTDSSSGRRALSFATDPITSNIYIGYSSNKNKSGSIIKIVDLEKNELSPINKSEWEYKDGWYRSIEFSKDGKYILCAGLKNREGNNPEYNISVVFDRDFNIVASLKGHEKSILCARFVDCKVDEDEKTSCTIVSCSDDGFVNVYAFSFTPQQRELCFEPFKKSQKAPWKLFDILIDGQDLLTTCLDGCLYRWKNFMSSETNEFSVDYRNICGLWTVGSDFSSIDEKSDITSVYKHLKALNNVMPQKEGNDEQRF